MSTRGWAWVCIVCLLLTAASTIGQPAAVDSTWAGDGDVRISDGPESLLMLLGECDGHVASAAQHVKSGIPEWMLFESDDPNEMPLHVIRERLDAHQVWIRYLSDEASPAVIDAILTRPSTGPMFKDAKGYTNLRRAIVILRADAFRAWHTGDVRVAAARLESSLALTRLAASRPGDPIASFSSRMVLSEYVMDAVEEFISDANPRPFTSEQAARLAREIGKCSADDPTGEWWRYRSSWKQGIEELRAQMNEDHPSRELVRTLLSGDGFCRMVRGEKDPVEEMVERMKVRRAQIEGWPMDDLRKRLAELEPAAARIAQLASEHRFAEAADEGRVRMREERYGIAGVLFYTMETIENVRPGLVGRIKAAREKLDRLAAK